jgi:hypothetical protein
MTILSSDSDPEELETAALPSQTTIVGDTITSPATAIFGSGLLPPAHGLPPLK